ncbi:MAG TPA: MOSC domain-containing protein [Pyrinomonadaceae bacterium]|nr:MOSC domain-containing protein [Pyrinomonadaceae bacterium]
MPGSQGHIHQLNCSGGGVPKLPVEAAQLTPTGIVGDRQRRPFHGGPQRALCLYSLEVIRALQAEGHPIYPGSVGENVTVAGLDWSELVPGRRLALGDEVIIELTSYTQPCRTIGGSFGDGKFNRISQKEHAGESRLYARVIRTGRLAVGQQVRVLEGEAAAAAPQER